MSDLTLEPDVVEEQVRRLNKQADSAGFLGVVAGVPLGLAIGALPVFVHTAVPSKFGLATVLLGALVAGVLGHRIGSSRAFGYRLRAQLLLGQLRLEQNVQALLAVSERPAPAALPAPEHEQAAAPEPPRIDEIVDAGLAMSPAAPHGEVAPTFEWPPVDVEPLAYPPPVEVEEIAPVPPVPAAAPVVAPQPEPQPVPEPVAAPAWAAQFAAAPPAAEPAPAWSLPAQDEPMPAPAPEPLPKLPAWAEIAEVAPAPATAPDPAPAAAPAPAWTPPVGEPQSPPAQTSQPAPPSPAAPPAAAPPADLGALSIAEIARLADTGSL